MVKDADRFKMDLVSGLKQTLHGEVKPSICLNTRICYTQSNKNLVITQCCMRHLYALSAAGDQNASFIIEKAKLFERRRCGHLPADYPEPLSAVDCISSVVDPKGSGRNKNRYVIASTDEEVREKMEGVLGTPFVFVNKSVMIMARMPENSAAERVREERHKFRDQLKKLGGNKRKRGEDEGDDDQKVTAEGSEEQPKKKKKAYGKGPKEPNPLSVKKPKKKLVEPNSKPRESEKKAKDSEKGGEKEVGGDDGSTEQSAKRKRKRKHKSAANLDGSSATPAADTSGQED